MTTSHDRDPSWGHGTIHDFLMLNPVRGTAAATAALEQATHVLRKALGTS